MHSEKELYIQKLITREKKARFNWIMAVTGLPEEELQQIVKNLGFMIKGDFITLPSEIDKIVEVRPKKHTQFITTRRIRPVVVPPPLPKSPPPPKYSFCTNCGVGLKDPGNVYELTGFCPNCGIDLESIYLEDKSSKEPYKRLHCNECGNINPQNVQFCFYCGSSNLSPLL